MQDFRHMNKLLLQNSRNIRRYIEQVAPTHLGPLAVTFALENFQKEGFQGKTFQLWKGLATLNKKTGKSLIVNRKGQLNRYGRSITGRKVLSKTGRLRTSVRPRYLGQGRVAIVGVDYGKYHNTGTATLPQRTFIAASPLLTKRVATALRGGIKKLLT